MDKAIIFGIYEFLGFQLCLDLLEKGIEVKGIDFEMNRTDPFIEEKKMLIGRNGNFQEESLNDFILTDKQNDTFIFIDYYSYYIKQAEKELLSAISSVCLDGNAQFVFLFPIQLSSEMQEKKKPFLPKNIIDNYSISFYLPTIYGSL
jgi:hypothetical protein